VCLLVLAWQAHPCYRLVVAANRDEFHARPAAAMARWPPPDDLIAGRDLRAQGTWLGIDRERRFGVVTNFRELQSARPGAPSRGNLIPEYLAGPPGDARRARAGEFFAALEPHAAAYSGFNLLLTDADSLWYGSNRASPFARRLEPGVYGLSNELLDTPWPKLQRVRASFESWLRQPRGELAAAASRAPAAEALAAEAPAAAAELFALLADRTPAAELESAHTGGLPPELARPLSAPFVLHPQYGTRCSTVVLLEPAGGLYLAERRFASDGQPAGQSEFMLNPGEWP
jgi:uncharacterized protein with NRDE domain